MRVYEKIVRVQYARLTCRIWIADWNASDMIIDQAKSILKSDISLDQMIDRILDIHTDVNTVEIVDPSGHGPIGHRQWP